MEKTYLAALPDETAILARARIEPEAFAEIYDHYFKRVYNYIRYRLDSIDATEELTSQVFESVLRKLNTYNADKAPFAAWIFAIVRNTVNDHYRRSRKTGRWLSLEIVNHCFSPQPGPEEKTIQNENRAQLFTALASLEERERDIIALKYAFGLKNRSIAELTGISETNIGVILYRAMRKLRNSMESMEVDRERV